MTLPNYTFFGIEEINSLIYNHAQYFEDYYDFTPSELDTSDNYTNYRYDFIVVSKSKFGNTYEYLLEIRNALWTGEWSFISLPEGVNTPKVTLSIDNPNMLKITGDNLDDFTIRLHLSNLVDTRVFSDVEMLNKNMMIEGIQKVTGEYCSNSTMQVTILEDNGTPINGANISLLFDEETYTFTTNTEGVATLTFPQVERPGNYLAEIEVTNFGYYPIKRNINVEKTKAKIDIDNLHGVSSSRTIYYGAINICNLNLICNSQVFEDILNTNISLKYNSTNTTCNVSGTYSSQNTSFKLNLRGYWSKTVILDINIPETEYSFALKKSVAIQPTYFIANNYASIKSEIEDTNGSDLIRLRTSTTYNRTALITLNRNITIQGQKTNTGWSSIHGNNNTVFRINKGCTLKLVGIKCDNANQLITQYEGSTLSIDGCYFTNCENTSHKHKGTVIYCKVGSNSKKDKKLFTTTISNTYFINNVGSAIYHGGQLTINKCYFKKDNFNYLPEPQVLIVDQVYGNCTIKNSDCWISTGTTALSSTNKAYTKNFVYCGKTATINGKNGTQMKGDNKFNFLNSPYNNRGYIYMRYYYPYGGVNANIVASPKVGYESKCACHCVEGTNWTWKTHVQLTRVSWGTDNKKVGFTITNPSHGGYW